jgi:hypothetical protein
VTTPDGNGHDGPLQFATVVAWLNPFPARYATSTARQATLQRRVTGK